ncbi:hypothetical protein HDU86_003733 [Geranomyces michiganensis]|nr:hypothetical protein HDU86_003733 [Geranomyces michiganensis]
MTAVGKSVARLARAAVPSHLVRPVVGRTPVETLSELTIHNPKGDNSVFEAEACSGAPAHVSGRSVRISTKGPGATQSGLALADKWHITFDQQERWENPLMGWTSSHDPVQGLQGLSFKTKDDAIRFALRQGYEYWVEEPKTNKFRVKTYADNFKFFDFVIICLVIQFPQEDGDKSENIKADHQQNGLCTCFVKNVNKQTGKPKKEAKKKGKAAVKEEMQRIWERTTVADQGLISEPVSQRPHQ